MRKVDGRCRIPDDRSQRILNAEVGIWKWEVGMRKWEVGMRKVECGRWNAEV